MGPNERPGKTRPLVKSGIFFNWEKGPKNDYIHARACTHTHVYTYIQHTVG